MIANTQQIETAEASVAAEKPTKTARVGKKGANVAPRKGKSGKKASPAKKAPKGQKRASAARDGSKTAKVLELLKRPGGVTAKELMKANGLAAAFCARVPLGDDWQEDGADRHIDQG